MSIDRAEQRQAQQGAGGDEVAEHTHDGGEQRGTAREEAGRAIGEPAVSDHGLESAGQPGLAAEGLAAGARVRARASREQSPARSAVWATSARSSAERSAV